MLLIQSFSFGKSQETEMPTNQPPFLCSTITEEPSERNPFIPVFNLVSTCLDMFVFCNCLIELHPRLGEWCWRVMMLEILVDG